MKAMTAILQLFILVTLIVTFSFEISGQRMQNRMNAELAQRITLLEACGCQGSRAATWSGVKTPLDIPQEAERGIREVVCNRPRF